MSRAFERELRFVTRRLTVNLLISRAGWVLMLSAAVLALAILIERLLAVAVVSVWLYGSLGAILAVVLVATYIRSRPDQMRSALELDERLAMKERFSTALALVESEDPFARAACRQARARAEGLDVRSRFPLKPPAYWRHTAVMWAVVVALAMLMPQKDLLGFLRRDTEQQAEQKQKEQARTEVTKATEAVETVVNQLNDPNLQESLADLTQAQESEKPAEIKRQAIKQLGELSEKIKTMRGDPDLESAAMLKKMLKGLRGSTDELSMKLRSALANGDFGEARKLMEQLQKALAAGDMKNEQLKQLSDQLGNLAKELARLAEKNDQLEKELEKLGLKKELAGLDPDKLREALARQGLNKDLIEKLVQKAGACNNASARCSALAQAMAGAVGGGQMAAGDLSEMLEQLTTLEALDAQMAAMEASLAEITRAIAGLGAGMCDGLGGQGPFSEGDQYASGSGTGGPGRGFGPRDSDIDGDTTTAKTVVKSDAEQGPAIASWYFKDQQVKGDAQRQFSEVVAAGRERAAEAISENQIPRKYEDAVKQYFGTLEQSKQGE